MSNDQLKSLNFTFTMRPAPRNGPTSSDAWNDSLTELASDLSSLALEWNNKLTSIIEGLPNGSKDSNINVFIHGLDGKNLWVDLALTSSSEDLTFFSTTKNRPYTVEEAFRNLYGYVDDQIDQVRTDLGTGSGGGTSGSLTADQIIRIGANIFDATQLSSATSLDGKSERNRLNINQLAYDLYGPGYSLGGDGNGDLTYTVMHMVDALLTLHDGNWSDDISLNHNGITVLQANVGTSHPGNDSYSGATTTCTNDLDFIRTKIKELKGTAGWLTNLPVLYTGGADSIYDLLSNTKGSGTKSATNPWGYQYDDIEGLATVLDSLKTYLGQSVHTTSSPDYTSTTFINDGMALTTALSTLDAVLTLSSGIVTGQDTLLSEYDLYFNYLKTFTGQTSHTDNSPVYSGTYIVQNGTPLPVAIGALDRATDAIEDRITTLEGYRSKMSNFIGQATPLLETPSYSSTLLVTQGSDLETAIGALDAGIISVSGLMAAYLPLTGGTMLGNINLNGNSLSNVLNFDATTVTVDDLTVNGNLSFALTELEVNGTLSVIEDLYIGGDLILSGVFNMEDLTLESLIINSELIVRSYAYGERQAVSSSGFLLAGRAITTGSGLLGGGTLVGDLELSHVEQAGLTPGTYNYVTVDNLGHITTASNQPYVTTACQVNTGSNLTGGGALTGNLTLDLSSDISIESATLSEDLEVTISGYGVVLHSPNGKRWRIHVDDDGVLYTVEL